MKGWHAWAVATCEFAFWALWQIHANNVWMFVLNMVIFSVCLLLTLTFKEKNI